MRFKLAAAALALSLTALPRPRRARRNMECVTASTAMIPAASFRGRRRCAPTAITRPRRHIATAITSVARITSVHARYGDYVGFACEFPRSYDPVKAGRWWWSP